MKRCLSPMGGRGCYEYKLSGAVVGAGRGARTVIGGDNSHCLSDVRKR